MSVSNEPIGILSTGLYLPQPIMTAKEIAEASGLPEVVVEHKLGIRQKHVPGPDDHSCEMGIHAAREAIAKAGIDPKEIDLVIYIGEEHKEYPVWTAALKLQQEVGAVNAWAFDAALRCGTTIMALKVAKSLMMADESIRTVLLAGGYRNVDLIDYQNPRTRFMFNLAAGGGAMLLRKGHASNVVLESHLITDGAFAEDVIIPVGGTKMPLTSDLLNQGHGLYLDVPDPEGMKERLDGTSMARFVEVIRRAAEKSGWQLTDIDYLAILHMKKSAHDYVLQEIGLSQEQSVYLQDYGHVGQLDQILSLELGVEQGKIKNGDRVVLVSAGIGYAWGATAIRWGNGRND
ncbi:3-oxoacyl-ACP synthase [Paenibacillus alginolyticus]|uniref:3-oxoacyl-ACP synthase n=1 Tax=Paenibacillus alginolyticus TaxID=59839 RepID=A0ABT4GF12_9BACL|nr:3-oxoacyl-ACP synthase [Paenibacillus alginolyticus]MCY9694781.1 3-oxoacyl-ACP synthase [Paenibacillus alginolyticus]MEC0145781.1 3-oxoacyl-ACP synthase [Paenibacillus alginolyticus]